MRPFAETVVCDAKIEKKKFRILKYVYMMGRTPGSLVAGAIECRMRSMC